MNAGYPTVRLGVEGSNVNALGLKGSKRDDVQAQLDQVNQGLSLVNEIRSDLASDPSNFGLVGSVKKGAQELMGIASDVGGASGSVIRGRQALLDEINTGNVGRGDFLKAFDESIPQNEVRLEILTYALARSMQGDGKLLKDTIERARTISQGS